MKGQNGMTKQTWGMAQEALAQTVGQNNYKTWIEPIGFASFDDGVAALTVPTAFMGNYVQSNYADAILYQLNMNGLQADRLNFQVSRGARRATPGPTATARPIAAAPKMDMQGNPLNSQFTFDTFVVGKPNELAHAAARRVAEGGDVTFNPLFLYGGVGLGKTHLMHAIAHELQTRQPEIRMLYLSADQFMYRFIQAIRSRKTMDFKAMLHSVDILMIDDVQFIAGKDSTQEEFFHTFNALISANKQIIISADRAPGEIKDLEERIKSRLQSGLIVDLHPTNFELRLGILQSKAEMYGASYPDVKINDDVLEFLAHRISKNVRVLEGALTRLFAFAHLVGRPVDLELVQECLTDTLRESDRKVSIEEIQRVVCDHYNLRQSDLVGPKRLRAFARPRQVAMFLAKTMTQRSLPEIGRKFGWP
jgi:chromosomal replication initiator protein